MLCHEQLPKSGPICTRWIQMFKLDKYSRRFSRNTPQNTSPENKGKWKLVYDCHFMARRFKPLRWVKKTVAEISRWDVCQLLFTPFQISDQKTDLHYTTILMSLEVTKHDNSLIYYSSIIIIITIIITWHYLHVSKGTNVKVPMVCHGTESSETVAL